MITRVLPGVAGFFGLVLSLAAQSVPVADGLAPLPLASGGIAGSDSVFATTEVELGRSFPGFLWLALTDGGAFSFPGSLGWMEPTPAVLPAFTPEAPRRVRVAGAKPSLAAKEDSLVYLSDEKPDLFYTGGEVGFVYGRYTGKGGGAIKQGYFLTEIGNDKFHLTVGASYTEDEGRYPNRRR